MFCWQIFSIWDQPLSFLCRFCSKAWWIRWFLALDPSAPCGKTRLVKRASTNGSSTTIWYSGYEMCWTVTWKESQIWDLLSPLLDGYRIAIVFLLACPCLATGLPFGCPWLLLALPPNGSSNPGATQCQTHGVTHGVTKSNPTATQWVSSGDTMTTQ